MLRAGSVHARRALRLCRLRRHGGRRRPDARQRPRRHRVAAAAAEAGGDGQAPRRAGLHGPGRRADRAQSPLRQRRGPRAGRPHRGGDARRRVPRLRGNRQGQGSVSAAGRGAVPRRAPFRVAPARRHQVGHPRARHPQQPHAVDRADGNHLARVRRQRVERHRARVQLVLPAQEAHARRHDEGVPGRGSRVPAVQAHARHRRRGRARALRSGRDAPAGNGVDRRRRHAPRDAAARVRQRAADERAGPHADERGRAALRRHRDQQDGERPGRLSVRGVQGPLFRGVEGQPEGHRDVPAEQPAGRGARGRARRRAGRRAAGLRYGGPGSTHSPRPRAPAAAVQPALAGPPRTRERQSVLDLRGPPSARRLRRVHRPHRRRQLLSVRSVDQRRGAAARPGRHREDAVDGHADRRPQVARHEALGAAEGERRRRLRDGDASRRAPGARAEPRVGVREADPLPLRRAGRVRRRRHRTRHRSSTR